MRAEKIVKALLDASAAVAAIVGTRIYGGVAPEEEPAPLVVFRKAGAQRPQSEDGGLLDPEVEGQIVSAAVDVLCIAGEYPQLKALGEAVRQALAYEHGTVAGETLLGIEIADEGGDQYDPELREHGQVWSFEVRHTEP